MITICLDESGNFEDKKYKKKIIGGLVYLGDDWFEEEKNIREFFINNCRKMGLIYPQDLHSTEIKWKGSKIKVEAYEKLIEKFKAYLNKNKNYSFAYMIKGKGSKINFNNSNIVRENEASNLYEIMANEFINNLLFYTLEYEDIRQYSLNIGTRSKPTKDKNEKEQLEKLGYKSKYDEGKRFYLTDQKTYKAAITNKIINSNIKKKTDIILRVESTDYYNGNENQALYIADLACDIIRDSLGGGEDFEIQRSCELLSGITSNPTLAWAYDEIDKIYNDIYTNYIQKDFIGLILNIYDIKQSKSSFKNYYLKKWIKPFENKLIDIFDKDKIQIYLSQLEYLFQKDVKEYGKALYGSMILKDVIYKYNADNKMKIRDYYMYKLLENILKGFNHQGNIKEAKKSLKGCVNLRDEVTINEYLNTLNRAAEIDANELNFKLAIVKLTNVLDVLDIQKETRKDICKLLNINGEKSYSILSRGKVLSSLGQMYSFIKDKENALKYFEEALVEFGENKLMKRITISYILHLAIDNEDFKLYKEYQMAYFGTEKIEEQFERIISNNNINYSDDFGFYVYVKSIKTFFINKISSELMNKLYVTDYEDKFFKVDEHPWELIYKNLALLFYNKGNKKFAERLLEKALTSVKNKGLTIELINCCSKLQFALFEGNFKELEKHIKTIKEKSEDHNEINEVFKECFQNENVKEIGENIVSKFSYMYT